MERSAGKANWASDCTLYREQRTACLVGASLTTALGMFLWVWDYTLSPADAAATLWPRMAYGPIGIVYILALLLRVPLPVASGAAAVTMVGWEIWFLTGILPRYQAGALMAAGSAQFFVMTTLVMTRCLPLRVNLGIIGALVAVPPVLVVAGWAPEFSIPMFLVRVVPAGVVAIAALAALAIAHRDGLRTRRLLENAQTRLNAIINNLPGIVYTARYDRGGIIAIEWVNGSDLDLPGLPMSQLTSLSREQLMARYHPDDVGQFADVYAKLERSEHTKLRARLARSDGGWVWVEHRFGILARNKDTFVVDGLMLDVTAEMEAKAEEERRQEERRHLERREMETQKLASFGKLAGGIAHDFNNILGATLGYGEFVVADTPAADTLHRYGEKIIKASHRGKTLVEQILIFARKAPSQKSRVDLAEVAAEAEKKLRILLPPNVDLLLKADNGLKIEADSSHIGQMLTNLATNARDALADMSGLILVSVREADLRAPQFRRLLDGEEGIERWQDPDGTGWVVAGALKPGKAYASLTVEDTGTGIPPSSQAHLFEPFFTTKGTGQGTGMGLAVVHGIVMSHGGAIIVRSSPGIGTEVEILLPLANAEPAEEAAPAHATGRVLVVDDDADACDMLAESLRRLGWEVVQRRDPLQALELLSTEGQWTAMVTDHKMPGLKGTELINRAKVMHPELVCILCTAYANTLTGPYAVPRETQALLQKPFNVSDLHSNLLDGVRAAANDAR